MGAHVTRGRRWVVRTKHIVEVQVFKSRAMRGRRRIIFTHDRDSNGVYGRSVTAPSYRRLVNIIGPLIFSNEVTVHFPDMTKQNWVMAVRKKKVPAHPTTTIGSLPHEILFNPLAASVSIYDPHDQSEVILDFEELADLWGWVNEQMQNSKQKGW